MDSKLRVPPEFCRNSGVSCNLMADCLVKVLQEIKDDKAKLVGIITDHGHRGGQDHFMVVVCWAGKNKKGHKTYKHFCPSIDHAGHSAQEAADAIKNVIEKFLGHDEVAVEVDSILGDSGGGGAVQHLYKIIHEMEIMDNKPEMKIMDDESEDANCSLHGMQKAIENESKNTMGNQGMCCRIPFQMLYVFSLLMKKIRGGGGIKMLDTLWLIVQHEIQENTKR